MSRTSLAVCSLVLATSGATADLVVTNAYFEPAPCDNPFVLPPCFEAHVSWDLTPIQRLIRDGAFPCFIELIDVPEVDPQSFLSDPDWFVFQRDESSVQLPNIVDDPGVPNIVIQYDGTDLFGPVSFDGFGFLTGARPTVGSYLAQAYELQSDTPVVNGGTFAWTPAPGTAGVLALGTLAFARRRR